MDCKMHPDLVTGFQKKKTRTVHKNRKGQYLNVKLMIIRFLIPVVINKLIRVECMFLSNTTLFYFMVEVYLYYYLRYNYMFRLLTIAIFRLYMNP